MSERNKDRHKNRQRHLADTDIQTYKHADREIDTKTDRLSDRQKKREECYKL